MWSDTLRVWESKAEDRPKKAFVITERRSKQRDPQ